ncbi:hypothetical protein JTE90_014883 [Oedothorax gibbosus]|uniref:Uncharacterized protein n=1 Tax=Oedothorax gibbosus TaxID=931172 RepID=A0AAV6TYH8_9ARAC|nr:hypothetical protein JTE90_014883 [Oedothorax gibbosus]
MIGCFYVINEPDMETGRFMEVPELFPRGVRCDGYPKEWRKKEMMYLHLNKMTGFPLYCGARHLWSPLTK